MEQAQAKSWLEQVDGLLYRTPQRAEREVWVAVVRAPRSGARTGKLIVALGDSPAEAAGAARARWQEAWRELSLLH